MSSTAGLATGFVRRQPQAAASVVAAQTPADATAFVEALPARDAADLLAAMNPRSAMSIVVALSPALSADVLDHMPFARAAAILRQAGHRDRQALLAGSSRRRRRDFEASLAFAPDTVGASMTLSLDALPGTDRVADALRLKRDSDSSRPAPVFVIDDQGVLVGTIPPQALLKHGQDVSLADIADRDCTAVSPHLKLSAIAGLDVWHEADELPVVSRRREVLGSIGRRQLKTAEVGAAPAADSSSLAVNLLETMGRSALDLADTIAPSDSSGGNAGVGNGR